MLHHVYTNRDGGIKSLVIAAIYFPGGWGYHDANAEMKSKLLMWHCDLSESRFMAKCMCCFLYWSCVTEKTRWARLIIDRGGTEKNSLFIIGLGYWVMTSHPHAPLHPSPRGSRIDLLVIFDCAPVLVTVYFVIIAFGPWMLNCCCGQWSRSWINYLMVMRCMCIFLCHRITIATINRFTD